MGLGAMLSNRIAVLQFVLRRFVYIIPELRLLCEDFIFSEMKKKSKAKAEKIKLKRKAKHTENESILDDSFYDYEYYDDQCSTDKCSDYEHYDYEYSTSESSDDEYSISLSESFLDDGDDESSDEAYLDECGINNSQDLFEENPSLDSKDMNGSDNVSYSAEIDDGETPTCSVTDDSDEMDIDKGTKIEDNLSDSKDMNISGTDNEDVYYISSDEEIFIDKIKKPIGLVNVNNTCFINAAIQALFRTISIDKLQEFKCNTKVCTQQLYESECILCLLLNQFQQISESTTHITPMYIINASKLLKFNVGEQECPSVIINTFLNSYLLHSGGMGIIERNTFCTYCKTISTTEIPDFFIQTSHIYNNQKFTGCKDIINKYCKEETIDDYACEVCRAKVECKSKMHIKKYPDIFEIVVPQSHNSKKSNMKVDLEEELVLSNDKFKLVSVIIHLGYSINAGHYISYIKQNHNWWKINDRKVEQVEWNHVKNLNPYILLYSKYDNQIPQHTNSLQNYHKEIEILSNNKELNDTIINFTIESYVQQSKRNNIHICSSFVWSIVTTAAQPEKISRQFNNIKKESEYILFPCCIGNKTDKIGHWIVIIYTKKKQYILDSFNGYWKRNLTQITTFIQ